MPVSTNLDPSKYIINLGGANITGFADGVFSSFEMDEDAINDATGADGLTTRIRSNNNTGLLTITLMQSSLSNNLLQGFYDLDRTTPKGFVVPLVIKNLLNTELIISSAVWVRKLPVVSQSKEVENREWPVKCADCIVTVAGNALFSGN